ncbi:right-handed parallel beta-helix repeat-containing protein [Bradyrhizobium zhanjiangense]|uniref:Right-handed parallel beta-helix repeat-containing protein n=1 Tax=Bradyrhizobium zhanjiangense TaxID=1325107 RepID=A0ABY0DMQ8_9BRAD|nr:right-handed parallel beta-helix repeat-containing protein [Bradyrhizobium zhanjiangense]RXG96242.1 right-handed parallel beta-helix repeat-containing protein [Bradyrhizobium zhanjiangense]
MKVGLYMLVASAIYQPQLGIAAGCDTTVNPGEDVSAAVVNAPSGSTVCLNTGTHKKLMLSGVAKSPRVTIRSASGKEAKLAFEIRNGTSGITFDNLTLTLGYIYGSEPHDITISHSDFVENARMVIDGAVHSNILLDGNTHNNSDIPENGFAGRVQLPYGGDLHSGVTIQNSDFIGGCSDGINAGIGVNIYNNRFINIMVGSCPNDPHTDAIQFVGATGSEGPHIKGNYFENNEQVLTAFDRIANATVEDNVFVSGPIGRPWQIEWYSDSNSTIRHNTLLYGANCAFKKVCGQIYLGRKLADPAGRGTIVVDNIATSISLGNGSTAARIDHNLVRIGARAGDTPGSPTFVGGANPATWSGFQLAPNSLGVNSASDGSNLGSRIFDGSASASAEAH